MSKLQEIGNGAVLFFCPGCLMPHQVWVEPLPNRPCWGYNNNPQAPTFTPSVRVQWGDEDGKKCCHTFVVEGRIQFLSDCTHLLAGQSVDLPDWDCPENLYK